MPTTPTLQDLVSAYLASKGKRSPYDLTRDPVLSFPGIPNLASGDFIVPPILPPQGGTDAARAEADRIARAAAGGDLSGGGGGGSSRQGGEAGGMGEREGPGYGSLGKTAENTLGVLGTLASLVGLGPLGLTLGGIAAASKLGDPFTADPLAGLPTESAIRTARDYDPNLAARLDAERQAGIADLAEQMGQMQSQAMKDQREGERTGIAPGVRDNPPGFDPEGGKSFGPSIGENTPGSGERAGETGGTPGGPSTGENSPGSGERGGETGGTAGGGGGGGGGDGSSDSASCFGRGSLVRLADGSDKPIEEVVVGDQVSTWNETEGRFCAGSVTKLFPGRAHTLVVLILSPGQEIQCTPGHRFYLDSGKWLEAGALKPGDKLHSGARVISTRLSQGEVPVWNFRVEPSHTYVVAEQVVHNWKARGGVIRATRPTTETFGEAGKETAVFVPEWMKKPGIQGKERSIIAALETLLKQLRASAGKKKEAR